MQKAKILFINSERECRKLSGSYWLLREGEVYTLGRKTTETVKVDIDLSFDHSVSRNHAKIWFDGKAWSIQDTSTYGTSINAKTIPANKVIELKFDDEISVGNKTTLVFIPDTREHIFLKDAWLEIGLFDTLNCALVFNGLPLLEKVIIHNCAKTAFLPSKLRLSLSGLLDASFDIPNIDPGKSFTLQPELKIAIEPLESQTEDISMPLRFFINDALIFEKQIRILVYNAWSKENINYHRISLASFVLPNDPIIGQVSTEIRNSLSLDGALRDSETVKTMRSVYDYFLKLWQIDYIDEQVVFEIGYQKIRLPHQLLSNLQEKRGSGTCLDLSLLFASFLENLEEQPLILLSEINPSLYHALVGCRKKKCIVLEPLIDDKAVVEENYFILDPTGISQGLKFDTAVSNAIKILKEKKFIFALDVIAARRYKILPLPFSGRPKESLIVSKVDKLARDLAEQIGAETGYRVYSTTHLLLALFLMGEGFTKEVFERLNYKSDKATTVIKEWLMGLKPETKIEAICPSEHYHSVFSLATHKAKVENAPLVMEKHLFLALLEVESPAFDRIISRLGTNRQALKQAAQDFLEIKPAIAINKSFLGSG